MEKILSVSGLQKSYVTKGNTYPVLRGVSMEMDRGEFVAVMGPSGSGKTTLLNIVSGFLSADSGQVKVGSVDMLHTGKEKQAEIRSGILGFIFQDFMLIDGLTVQENIFLPQIIAKKPAADMEGKQEICCAPLALRIFPANIRASFPAVKSSGWLLQGLYPTNRC